jgi:lysophospholipase L1-like esterase
MPPGPDYQPCPTNGDPCKILPLGDSITWGIGYDGAYRVRLFELAVNAGQNITFTGSQMNGPGTVAGQPFPKSNEGHSGFTIDQDKADNVLNPAFATTPHIILVHLGTNDSYGTQPKDQMADRLGALVDELIERAPEALIVVAQVTPHTFMGNENIDPFNAKIPALVDERAAAGKHVALVDLNTGFETNMLGDGVHPNKAGYDWMAERWYEVIGPLLPLE